MKRSFQKSLDVRRTLGKYGLFLFTVSIAMSATVARADDVTSTPAVKSAMQEAWVKSFPHLEGEGFGEDHATNTHEEGGWIVRDTRTGEIKALPTDPGKPRDDGDKSKPVALPPRTFYENQRTKKKYADNQGRYEIIAGYHTHPTNDSHPGTPSEQDFKESNDQHLPEYIIDETGIYKLDPGKQDNPDTENVDERISREEDPRDTAARNQAARQKEREIRKAEKENRKDSHSREERDLR